MSKVKTPASDIELPVKREDNVDQQPGNALKSNWTLLDVILTILLFSLLAWITKSYVNVVQDDYQGTKIASGFDVVEVNRATVVLKRFDEVFFVNLSDPEYWQRPSKWDRVAIALSPSGKTELCSVYGRNVPCFELSPLSQDFAPIFVETKTRAQVMAGSP